MPKKLTVAMILILAIVNGCGNEDPAKPGTTDFSVNLTVTDPAGDPVSGLEAKLHVLLPPQIMPNAAKVQVKIPFSVPVTAAVSLIVYDMDGNIVNSLIDQIIPAGENYVVLAKDEEGNPLIGTHLYRCEMVATVEGVEQFRAETFVTLYTGVDIDQRPVLGLTDARGQLTYNKRTEFPRSLFLMRCPPER